MTRASVFVVVLALLLPSVSRATPVLHVDPSLDDCDRADVDAFQDDIADLMMPVDAL